MKILGMLSIAFGVIGGIVIAASGRIPDGIAGAIIFIGLGIYLSKKAKEKQ